MTESKLCSIHRFEERDIDLLLAEEFRVNAEFGQWFMQQCDCSSDLVFPAFETKVSVYKEGRESDVAVLFDTQDGHRHRLYVEDKITASILPDQLERYVKRAEAEKKRGETAGWSIVLFAPRFYPGTNRHEKVSFVSFEDAAKHLDSASSDERSSYRAEFLIAAADYASLKGSANRDQYTREVEPHVARFWDAVHEMLEYEFSGYFIHETKYPSDYSSPKTEGWPQKRARVDFIWHKGAANLVFKKANYERLMQCIEEIGNCPGKFDPPKKGKSPLMRVSSIVSFSTSDDLSADDTRDCVKKAYEKVKELMDYYLEHRDIFEKAFDDGA